MKRSLSSPPSVDKGTHPLDEVEAPVLPKRRFLGFLGVRPDQLNSLEAIRLEMAREQVRDSRWQRRKSQLCWLLPTGLGPALLVLWHVLSRIG